MYQFKQSKLNVIMRFVIYKLLADIYVLSYVFLFSTFICGLNRPGGSPGRG